jgi:hypothetical protein
MEADLVKIPDCPVFRPTAAEFADPLLYIEKIRRQAQKTGICKIVPPPNWQPPCKLKPSLEIKTRVQPVYKIECSARIRHGFLM